jgi:hypothetical protein
MRYHKSKTFLVALIPVWISCIDSSNAQNAVLDQAIKDYYAGDYQNAAGHLGEAEAAEFNNPKLHYFLANSYIHLNQKDAAIREYRIAYALEPEGEVGSLSKQALALCGVDQGQGQASKLKDKPRGPAERHLLDDPLLKGAFARLQQNSENIKQTANSTAQAQASGLGKLADIQDQMLRRSTQETIDDLINSRGRHSNTGPLIDQTRSDSTARGQSMQRDFDNQRNLVINNGRRRVSAIDETANNLQQLMSEPAKPGHVKLSPLGTNIYVRNYDQVPPAETQPVVQTMPPQTTPQ